MSKPKNAAETSGTSPTLDRKKCVKVGPFFVHPLATLAHNLRVPPGWNTYTDEQKAEANAIRSALDKNGIVEKIKVWGGDVLLDGVTRLEWLLNQRKHGAPVPTIEECQHIVENVDIPEENIPDYIAACNVMRRELTKGHCLWLAFLDLPAAEEAAEKRKRSGVKGAIKEDATETVAKRWKTNATYVKLMKKFDPDLRKEVRDGLAIAAAHRKYLIEKGKTVEREEYHAELKSGGKKPAGKNTGRSERDEEYLRQHHTPKMADLLAIEPDQYENPLNRVAAVAARLWRDQDSPDAVKALIIELGKALEKLTDERLLPIVGEPQIDGLDKIIDQVE